MQGKLFVLTPIVTYTSDDSILINRLVGRLSTLHSGRLDSKNAVLRLEAELSLKREIQWTSHIGVSSIMFAIPNGAPSSIANFSRFISSALDMVSYSQIWLQCPSLSEEELDSEEAETDMNWKKWNIIRSLCQPQAKLSLALQLTSNLPSDAVLSKWLAEPIACVILPTSIFLTNAKGYPVLSKRHQSFLRKLFKRDPFFIVQLPPGTSLETSNLNGSHHLAYLRHLYKNRPEPDVIEKFAMGYQDYLQAPLQPLMDNLEAQTYDVFMKDNIKYELYEKAVYNALLDRVPAESGIVTVILVVGAGSRGPLVECCLRASEKSRRRIKCYAVEKNINAVVSLRAIQEAKWGKAVSVVYADMRQWTAPEKADIIVSELLGSFGDNELSPECLDGVQRFLKTDGISIPHSYTSFVAPLSSVKLHNEASAFKDIEHMETPYVVKFQNVHVVDEPKEVWKFEHPNPQIVGGPPNSNLHNVRYSHTFYKSSVDVTLHGMAGYFECVLYKDVLMSIVPKTHSENMTSWFPIFFPIKEPIHAPRGSTIHIHMWRLADTKKVWYEWAMVPELEVVVAKESSGDLRVEKEVMASQAISNVGGRSWWVGL